MYQQTNIPEMGINCVAIHKVSQKKGIELPQAEILIYLAGVIYRTNNPQDPSSAHVVHSKDELTTVIRQNELDPQPHALPLLVSQASGDFSLNLCARVNDSDTSFTTKCYGLARYYSEKIGREAQAQVLGLLAEGLPYYWILLSAYHSHLEANPEFQVTDDDCEAFKEDFERDDQPKLITTPTIKTTISKKLLI